MPAEVVAVKKMTSINNIKLISNPEEDDNESVHLSREERNDARTSMDNSNKSSSAESESLGEAENRESDQSSLDMPTP